MLRAKLSVLVTKETVFPSLFFVRPVRKFFGIFLPNIFLQESSDVDDRRRRRWHQNSSCGVKYVLRSNEGFRSINHPSHYLSSSSSSPQKMARLGLPQDRGSRPGRGFSGRYHGSSREPGPSGRGKSDKTVQSSSGRASDGRGSSGRGRKPGRRGIPKGHVVRMTADNILAESLNYVGFEGRQQNVNPSVNYERFRSFFGIGPKAAAAVFLDIQEVLKVDSPILRYFVMALYWMKSYDTLQIMSGWWKLHSESISKWVWYYIEKIQELKPKKVGTVVA